MGLAVLPRRDDDARAALAAAARRAGPVVLAGERTIPVGGELGELIPGGALGRGSVVAVAGEGGAGATTVGLRLAAAATDTGEWAAAIEVGAGIGGLAAQAAGVALDRFAIVRSVPPARWSSVVAALLDGMLLVLADVPPHLRVADARRLAARARERDVVLVPMGAWPAEAALRLRAEGSTWLVSEPATGVLSERVLRVHVDGRGAAARPRSAVLAETG